MAMREENVPVRSGESPIAMFRSEMNRLFQDFFGEALPQWWGKEVSCSGVCPVVDVTETDGSFRVTAEVPGLDAKDISVTVNDRFVTIRGEKEAAKEEKNGYIRQERSYGAFQRVIALPPDIANTEKAEAGMTKGVLTITVPKKAGAESKARKLEIKQAA